MIKYRCTHDAGTDHQCYTEAYKKVAGRWLCKDHMPIPQTPYEPPKKPKPYYRADKKVPEEWKAYNRQYRREYRRTHPRKPKGYNWELEITIYSNPFTLERISLWRLEQSFNFGKALYRCERCGSEVEVTRKAAPYPRNGWRKHFCGSTYYRNQHYKVSADHECKPYPSSAFKMIHCNRCGILASNKVVRHNRYPAGHYYFDLCLQCWREMRPLFVMENEQYELMKLLREFKSLMRKSDLSVHAKSPKLPDLPNYTENWYRKYPYI